jgi:hypothetical protein
VTVLSTADAHAAAQTAQRILPADPSLAHLNPLLSPASFVVDGSVTLVLMFPSALMAFIQHSRHLCPPCGRGNDLQDPSTWDAPALCTLRRLQEDLLQNYDCSDQPAVAQPPQPSGAGAAAAVPSRDKTAALLMLEAVANARSFRASPCQSARAPKVTVKHIRAHRGRGGDDSGQRGHGSWWHAPVWQDSQDNGNGHHLFRSSTASTRHSSGVRFPPGVLQLSRPAAQPAHTHSYATPSHEANQHALAQIQPCVNTMPSRASKSSASSTSPRNTRQQNRIPVSEWR